MAEFFTAILPAVGTLVFWLAVTGVAHLAFTRGVRWLMARFESALIESIVAVVRKPLMLIIVIAGVLNTLGALPLPEVVSGTLVSLANSALVLVLAFLILRVAKDVLLGYAIAFLKRVGSRAGEIISPIFNMFAAPTVATAAIILVLNLWGIDVTSLLVGAGILGLVLGMAMQDMFVNIFSGLTLVADAPFKPGDLISTQDGKLCRVDRMGLRSTVLHALQDHALMYVPNKDLANTTVVNISQPSTEMRQTIDVAVQSAEAFERAQALLLEIANAHPNVLGDCETKLEQMWKHSQGRHGSAQQRMQIQLERKKAEHKLLQSVQEVHALLMTIREPEQIATVDPLLHNTVRQLEAWVAVKDPWLDDREYEWWMRNWLVQGDELKKRWEAFKREIGQVTPTQANEAATRLAQWVENSFVWPTRPWQMPKVLFKAFEGDAIQLQLDFYVDDVRLEHCERHQRVVCELALEISQRLTALEPAPEPAPDIPLLDKPEGTPVQIPISTTTPAFVTA
jgi:MscS family membrane protein